MAQHGNRNPVKPGNAAQDRAILAAAAVTPLLKKIREKMRDVIHYTGAAGIPCQYHLLPGRQLFLHFGQTLFFFFCFYVHSAAPPFLPSCSNST